MGYFPVGSETQLSGKLDLSRRQLTLYHAKGGVINDAADQPVVWMIRQVEEFRTNLQVGFFREAEIAGKGYIQVDKTGTDHRVPADIAERINGLSESGGVEPLGRAPLVRCKIR